MYFNKSIDKLTIALLEIKNDNLGGWSAVNGLMVTAPALDRTEAIGISNEIMSKYLNGFTLQ